MQTIQTEPAQPLSSSSAPAPRKKSAVPLPPAVRALLFRLIYTIPVVWLVVSIVFFLIHLVPGDPIVQMLGEGATASQSQSVGRRSRGPRIPS